MSTAFKISKREWLDSLNVPALAFWLTHSFSPERFKAGDDDVVCYAIELLRERSLIADEFVNRLWGMFGLEPGRGMNNV